MFMYEKAGFQISILHVDQQTANSKQQTANGNEKTANSNQKVPTFWLRTLG